MKSLKIFTATATLLLSFSAIGQTLYINGNVITVDSTNRMAEALVITEGKIVAVGTTEEVLKYQAAGSTVVDLHGKAVVPGFIDGHSHFMSLLFSKGKVNLGSPPMGKVSTIQDLVHALQKFQQEQQMDEEQWLQGYGYDQDQLLEGRHPTKKELDEVFPNTPVFIMNINGHMGVANSAALRLSSVNASTPNPLGGAIEKDSRTGEPTGLLQENAKDLLAIPDKPTPTLEEELDDLDKQQRLYASRGITTAQEGLTSLTALKLLKQAADRNRLIIDVEALPAAHYLDEVITDPDFVFGALKNHLKLAGIKQVADGSPQGKTAYFSKPYLTEVPGCNHDECHGFPTVDQEGLNAFILKAFKNGIRPFVHCNGDATIDMYLSAIAQANEKLGTHSVSFRPVTIHSQFVRLDQLDQFKALGIIPAFFSNHAFFWGDVHIRNLGSERASFLSPLKTALDKGIIATNHTDYPVTPINQLFLIWSAVNRETRSGKIIGPQERLTPLEALRSVTINGAYQYQEEHLKGSIEPGKLADLVILSKDIINIDPATIKDVEVLETIKEGITIYKKM